MTSTPKDHMQRQPQRPANHEKSARPPPRGAEGHRGLRSPGNRPAPASAPSSGPEGKRVSKAAEPSPRSGSNPRPHQQQPSLRGSPRPSSPRTTALANNRTSSPKDANLSPAGGGRHQSVGSASRTSISFMMGNMRHRISRSAADVGGQRSGVRRLDLFQQEAQQRTEIASRLEAEREFIAGLFAAGSIKAKDASIIRLENLVNDLIREKELNLFNSQRDIANVGRCLASLYHDCLQLGMSTVDSFPRCISDEDPAVYAKRITQLKLNFNKTATVSSKHFMMPPPSPTSEARMLYTNALAAFSPSESGLGAGSRQLEGNPAKKLPSPRTTASDASRDFSPPALRGFSSAGDKLRRESPRTSLPRKASQEDASNISPFRFPASGISNSLTPITASNNPGSNDSVLQASHTMHPPPTLQRAVSVSNASPERASTLSLKSPNAAASPEFTPSNQSAGHGVNGETTRMHGPSGGKKNSTVNFSVSDDAETANSDGTPAVGSLYSDSYPFAADKDTDGEGAQVCPTCHRVGVTNPSSLTNNDTSSTESAAGLAATLVSLFDKCGVAGSYVSFVSPPHSEVTISNIETFIKDLSNNIQHLLHIVAGKLRYSDTRMAHLERVLDDKQSQLIATERMLQGYLIRAPSDINRSIDMVRAIGEEVQERLFEMERKLLDTMDDLLAGGSAILLYEDLGPTADPKAPFGGGPEDVSHKRSTAVHTATSTVLASPLSLPGIDSTIGGAGAGTKGSALKGTTLRHPETGVDSVSRANSNGLLTTLQGSSGKTREERLEAHKAALVARFKAQVSGIRSAQAELLQDLRDEILSLQRERISQDISRGVPSPHTDESIKFCITDPVAVQDSYKALLTRHGQFVPSTQRLLINEKAPLANQIQIQGGIGTDSISSPVAYFHSGRHLEIVAEVDRHERTIQEEASAKAKACLSAGGISHPLLRTNIPIHYRQRLETDEGVYDRAQLLRLIDLVSHEPRVSEAITCVMAEFEEWEKSNPAEAQRLAEQGKAASSTWRPKQIGESTSSSQQQLATSTKTMEFQLRSQARREEAMLASANTQSSTSAALPPPLSLLERILATGTNLEEERKEEQYVKQYERFLLSTNGGSSRTRLNSAHQPKMIGDDTFSIVSRKELLQDDLADTAEGKVVPDVIGSASSKRVADEERNRQRHEHLLTYHREHNHKNLDPLVGDENSSVLTNKKQYPARNSDYSPHFVVDNMYSKTHQIASKLQVKNEQKSAARRNDVSLQQLLEEVPQNAVLDPVFSSTRRQQDGGQEGGGGFVDGGSRQPLLLATPAARLWHTASRVQVDNMQRLEEAVRQSTKGAEEIGRGAFFDDDAAAGRLVPASNEATGPIDFNALPTLNGGSKPFHTRRRLSGDDRLPALPGSTGLGQGSLSFRNSNGTKFSDAEVIRRHLQPESGPPPRMPMPLSSATRQILDLGEPNNNDHPLSKDGSKSKIIKPPPSSSTATNDRYLSYVNGVGGGAFVMNQAKSPECSSISSSQGKGAELEGKEMNIPQAPPPPLEKHPLFSGSAAPSVCTGHGNKNASSKDTTVPAYSNSWGTVDPAVSYALPTLETSIATKRLLERQRQLLDELK